MQLPDGAVVFHTEKSPHTPNSKSLLCTFNSGITFGRDFSIITL